MAKWDLSTYPRKPTGNDSLIAPMTRTVYTKHGLVLLIPTTRGTASTVFAVGVIQGYTYKGWVVPTAERQQADWPRLAHSFVRAARRLHRQKGRPAWPN